MHKDIGEELSLQTVKRRNTVFTSKGKGLCFGANNMSDHDPEP